MHTFRFALLVRPALVAAIWLVCATPARAQAVPAQPGTAASAALTDVLGGLNWTERRYKVEALRFKALDETGIDWWGDDEVMIGTFDAKGSTVSNEFGSVDSGDTKTFKDPAKSCIIAVRPGRVVLDESSVCDPAGEPAPFGFRVEFWEKDWQLGGSFCNTLGPSPGGHVADHCLGYGADDFIGWAQLDFPAADLEAALPNVGDQVVETVRLNPCRGVDVCDVTWGPDYKFTYRVTRLPDMHVIGRDLLDAVKIQIGARSDLEALAAGLRALRPLQPRKVEVERE